MNPPMYKRVRDVLSEAGLTTGYINQSLIWSDTGKITDRFIVFRPNGGSDIDRDIGGEYHTLVEIISGKGEAENSEQAMLSIIDFVKHNPLISSCLGQITNMGGIPHPVMTTEGRIVWRLQFACLYGD